MKKSILRIILTLVISILALTSCEGIFGQGHEPDLEKEDFSRIVVADGIDILEIRSAVFEILGTMPTSTDEVAADGCEIVIGDSNRPITAVAYAELQKQKKAGEAYGYAVYYDGNSVALVWDHANLRSLALNNFLEKCIREDKLDFDEGVVLYEGFSDKDTEQTVLWMAIEAKAPESVYKALQRLNAFFDGSVIIDWMANLWDGDIGGFYYSNSARDNEPHRPDLESTNFIVGFLTSGGAMTNVNDQLPNDIKIKILDFVIEMQYPDGYFYHPQWDKGTDKLQTDRYGRDMSHATELIKKLYADRDGDGVDEKQYPKYCTPSGLKCKEHTDTSESCNLASSVSSSGTGLSKVVACASSAVTSSVSSPRSQAASAVLSSTVTPTAAASDRPDYSSAASFKAWLETYNATLKIDSGKAHNLNALASEIKAHGYNSIMVEHLMNAQDEVYYEQLAAGETPSGLWQYEPNLKYCWSIHKYISFFASAKQSLRYHEHIVRSLIEIIKIPATSTYALHDHMNQWIAISEVIDNAKSYNPEVVDTLYEILGECAVELIDYSIDKLKPLEFQKSLFVYSYSMKVGPNIYGVRVSQGVCEADANGMLLVGNYYKSVFEAFGYDTVPLCTKEDGARFVETICDIESVVKNPLPKPDTIEFETERDITTRVNHLKNNSTSYAEIEDGALAFYSPASTSNDGDHLVITPSDTGGNCIIVEFDVLIGSTNINGDRSMQVKIGNATMLEIGVSGGYLIMNTASAYSTAIRDTIITTSLKRSADEWHTIRVELYDPLDEETVPRFKFFIDDEYIKESSIYFGSEVSGKAYSSTFSALDFYSMKSADTLIYLDNIYANREIKDYDPDNHDISDLRDE